MQTHEGLASAPFVSAPYAGAQAQNDARVQTPFEVADSLIGQSALSTEPAAQAERPLAIIIQSASAAGKTTLMDAVLSFFPEEERLKYSAMTGQSLFYLGEKDLKHKILAAVEEAKPIFMEVGQLIATLRKDVRPKSSLGKALSYAENQWPAMARYLEVAQAEPDNNSTEHALRGVVLGRRNWLHVGQEAGGEKAAISSRS